MIDASKHVGLVNVIAQRYRRSGIALEELIAEGTIGLMHAVRKFDPDRGIAFSTYASAWIHAQIIQFVKRGQRVVRHSLHRNDGTKPTIPIVSLDAPRTDDEAATLHEVITDDAAPRVDDEAARIERRREVRRAVKSLRLTKREAEIVRMHFVDGMTLAEIGRCFGFGRERTRQIKVEILTALRGRLGHLAGEAT